MAWEILTKRAYVTESMVMSPKVVSTILLQLVEVRASLPKKTIEGVREVALILREEGWGLYEE